MRLTIRLAVLSLFLLGVCSSVAAQPKQTSKSGREDPNPLQHFIVDNQLGFVDVQGGERLDAFLLTCHRQSGDCELIQAACMELKGAEPYVVINLPFHYSILSWDANGIVAQSDAAICMTDRLVLTFADKSAMLVKSVKKAAPEVKPLVSCENFKSETVQLYNERKP
jgi:hypothetical protein